MRRFESSLGPRMYRVLGTQRKGWTLDASSLFWGIFFFFYFQTTRSVDSASSLCLTMAPGSNKGLVENMNVSCSDDMKVGKGEKGETKVIDGPSPVNTDTVFASTDGKSATLEEVASP